MIQRHLWGSDADSGVSPVVGVVLLVAVVVILSAIVLAAVGVFTSQTENARAGVNVDYESESVINVQLDSMENADKVLVKSALGSTYELNNVGDSVQLLNLENEGRMTVVGVLNGERTVLRTIKPHSFKADYTVGKNQEFNKLSSAVEEARRDGEKGEVIVVKKGKHTVNGLDVEGVKIVGESGVSIRTTSTIHVRGKASVSNVNLKSSGGLSTVVEASGDSKLISVKVPKPELSLLDNAEAVKSDNLIPRTGKPIKSVAIKSRSYYNSEDISSYTFEKIPNRGMIRVKLSVEGHYEGDNSSTSGRIWMVLSDGNNKKKVTVFNSDELYVNYDSKSDNEVTYKIKVPSDWNKNNLKLTAKVLTQDNGLSKDRWIGLKAKVTAPVEIGASDEFVGGDGVVRNGKRIKVNKTMDSDYNNQLLLKDSKVVSSDVDIKNVSFGGGHTIDEFDLNITFKVNDLSYGKGHFLTPYQTKGLCCDVRRPKLGVGQMNLGGSWGISGVYVEFGRRKHDIVKHTKEVTIRMKLEKNARKDSQVYKIKVYHKGELVKSEPIFYSYSGKPETVQRLVYEVNTDKYHKMHVEGSVKLW